MYNQKEKNLIENALEIVKDREKNRHRKDKESRSDLIEQKKEIFLVTMGHNILQNEMQNLKEIDLEKQKAIQKSLEMLLADQDALNRFLEDNKNQTEEAQKV